MQHRRIELGIARGTQQAHRADDLILEKLEHAHDAGLAAGGEPVALHAAEPDEIGTYGFRLDDIAAAIEAAVDDDLGAAGNRLDDFRQNIGRAAAMIELTATVIGDEDEVDAMIEAKFCVFGGGDPFDGERDLELRLDALDGLPIERLLVLAA